MAARPGGAGWRSTLRLRPTRAVINLLGDGEIYGNIAIQDGDVINVEDGTTYFDGIIDPEFVPAGGVTADVLDTALAASAT